MMISARAIYHSIPLITFYLLTPSLFSPLFISIHKQLKYFSSWKRRPSPPQEKILQKMLSRRKFNPSSRRIVYDLMAFLIVARCTNDRKSRNWKAVQNLQEFYRNKSEGQGLVDNYFVQVPRIKVNPLRY